MTEHEHQDIVDRLRAVGREPVPPRIAAAHLEAIRGGGERSRVTRQTWRVAVAAAAAVLVLATSAAAAALIGGAEGSVEELSVGGPSADLVAVGAEDDAVADGDAADGNEPAEATGAPPVDPFPDDPCKGPPPFAGQAPESTEARAEEADELSARRKDCRVEQRPVEEEPVDEEPDEPTGAPPVDPFPDDPCKGPPPFAGQAPESGEARAEEAGELSAVRRSCPDSGDENGPAHENQPEGQRGVGRDAGDEGAGGNGPPVSVPARPPDADRGGQPDDTPPGPPPGTPADGQPDDTPPGPPPGTPADGQPGGAAGGGPGA